MAATTRIAAIVYAVGAIAAGLSLAINRIQHGYYRAARDRVAAVEDHYDVPGVARVNTTRGPRRITVTALTQALLAVLVTANVAGIVWTLS